MDRHQHDPKEAELTEESMSNKESQPNDPPSYKIVKWTNMTNERSKMSQVPADPGKPITRHGYKTVKLTDTKCRGGSQLSAGIEKSDYKLVKWTDMSKQGPPMSEAPAVDTQLPNRDYKVVKWTNASSEGSRLIESPVDLGSRDYKVVKWTNKFNEGSQLIEASVDLGSRDYKVVKWTNMSSQELGGTPVDVGMISHDYKIVKWVDMSKDGSQTSEAPVDVSCNNRTVELATSEGSQPSAEELVDAE